MNTLAFVADVHIGNHQQHGGSLVCGMNDRCRMVLAVLEKAAEVALSQGADSLIVLGDLFDTSKPLPQMIARVMDLRYRFSELHFVLVAGNHDRNSGVYGDNALGPLRSTCTVIEGDGGTVYDGVLLLPFNEAPTLGWIQEQIIKRCGGMRIRAIGGHFGLHDEHMRAANPWMEQSKNALPVEKLAVLLGNFAIPYLFAGDWHGHKQWYIDGVHIAQVGALAPTGWDNPGLHGYGGLTILEDASPIDTVTHYEIPGPRFATAVNESDAIALMSQADKDLHSLFLRCSATPKEAPDMLKLLEDDRVFAGSVVLDRKHAQAQAVSAAVATRSQTTLASAAEEYLSRIALPPNVSRARVAELTRGFLKL